MTHPTMQRIFDATGKTPAEIAKSIDVNAQNINNWSNRGISKTGAVAIAKKHNLSVDWILTGQGTMTVSNTGITVGGNNTNHGTQIGTHMSSLQNMPAQSKEQLDEMSANYPKDMPLFDIDAGVVFALDPNRLPQLIADSNERVATFIPHSGRAFGLKNSTDIVGVFDTPIAKNDILIVEPCIASRDGDLILLALNYPKANRGIIARILVSLSNDHSIKYSNSPAEPLPPNSVICGVVVEIKKRLIDTSLIKARLNGDWDIMSTLIQAQE